MIPTREAAPAVLQVRDSDLADALLRDPHVVAGMALGPSTPSTPGTAPTIAEFLAMWYTNGPDYPTVNSVLRRAFTARAVAGFAAPCGRLAARRAAALPPRGDLVVEYLSPALLHGTFTILGAPPQLWPRLERATAVLLRVFHGTLHGTGAPAPGAAHAFDVAIRYLDTVLADALDGGTRTPFLDALRHLADTTSNRWQLTAVLGQVLMAGTEPMIVGGAAACARLWSEPALRAGVTDGSVDVGAVVEEALRRQPPFPTLFRFVREPCDCTGERLPAGTVLAIDIAAVNLAGEPACPRSTGAAPPPASVLTFGRGDHYCLGAAAARMQVPTAVRELMRHQPGLRIEPDRVRIVATGFLREVRSMPYST